MGDFDGRQVDAAPDTAPGTVTGVRYWKAQLGMAAPRGLRLRGARDWWHEGVNEARCLSTDVAMGGVVARSRHRGHPAPAEGCSCGFWAYWHLAAAPYFGASPEFAGVIEGWGRCLIGSRGFRCQYARVVAVAVAAPLTEPDPDWQPSRRPPEGMFRRGPQGMDAWLAMTGRVKEHAPLISTPRTRAAEADARFSVALRYPGTEVYDTVDAMLAAHPVTAGYGEPAPGPAPPAARLRECGCLHCQRPGGSPVFYHI